MPTMSVHISQPRARLLAAKKIRMLFTTLPPMKQDRKFSVEGYMVKKNRIPFKLIVNAPNRKMAIELAYCLIGSRHRAKRSEIKLEKIEEVLES